MALNKRIKRAARKPWTTIDERNLRQHSKARTPAKRVARQMRRSEGATRQKAHSMGLSLGERRSA
jgi:hypothetical protein